MFVSCLPKEENTQVAGRNTSMEALPVTLMSHLMLNKARNVDNDCFRQTCASDIVMDASIA